MFPNGNNKSGVWFQSKGTSSSVSDPISFSVQQIGSLVRSRRQANGLTQRELSELAGVGLRFVSELERGKVTLRMDVVNRVLSVFGLMLGTVAAPRLDEEKFP